MMAHSRPATTEIYLQHGAAALTESDYELTCEPISFDQRMTTDPSALEAIEFDSQDWQQHSSEED